jgi:beta-lactamase regulating signal transducer with metallopeptidase domain
MDSWLLYLLKVSALTSLFYLLYLLLFSRDTFFLRNRILLILTLVLPIILPVIKYSVFVDSPVNLVTSSVVDSVILPETTSVPTLPNINKSFDYNNLLEWIYFSVLGLMLLKVAISLIATLIITRKGNILRSQFPKVIISENPHPPFSFFPYIVIPKDLYENGKYLDVIEHESAHVRQGHTFDLLLGEIYIAFQWFNPFAWFIKKSIILNHEYLADQASLINNNLKEYQFKLLSFQVELGNISMAHNFNTSIKNRIVMINKKPSSKLANLKNLLVLPILAFAAYAFVTPEYHYAPSAADNVSVALSNANASVKGNVLNEQNKPMWGVTISISNNAAKVHTDQNGSFNLDNVPTGTSIVCSFVGYQTLTLTADFSKSMTFKMVKDFDAPAPNIKMVPPKISQKGQTNQVKPLYIIDGVERQNDKEFLDPNTFNTAFFIKGDSATSIYGDKGKNGVVLITLTKDGKIKQNVPKIVK